MYSNGEQLTNMTAPKEVCGVKEDKHILLHRAISNLSTVITRLQCLKDRLDDSDRPVEDDNVKESLPSLLEVLNHYPDRLSDVRGHANSLIDEIEEKLFG